MKSGAMVGYLQEVSLDQALSGVNSVANGDSITALSVSERTGEACAECHHDLFRSIPVSPFHLTHMWARIGA